MIKEKELINIKGGAFSFYDMVDNVVRMIRLLGDMDRVQDTIIRRNRGKNGRKLLY